MGEMATSSHMQSINRLCLLRPARQEAELRERSCGLVFPGWGTGLLAGGGGLRRGFPWSGDTENAVMRVCVQDSWQPPALRTENFGDHRHKAESQVQSPFCVWKTQPSRTDLEPENDQLRDCAQIISPSASAPGIN